MNRRKQKLLKRYLDEMVMRLEKYKSDAEVSRFIAEQLFEMDHVNVAHTSLVAILESLNDYLDEKI